MASSHPQHPYQDPTLPISQRVTSLLNLMTLAEKAGQLFHDMLPQAPNGELTPANPAFGSPSARESVTQRHMSHFNLLGAITNPCDTAAWSNNLQRLARDETRLGIPVTLSTDPRNHFNDNPGAAFQAGVLSQWPETLGFAAIGDEGLVETFADMARREYLGVGLRVALHPQVDLATEYRWARCGATFGEDAELSGRLGAAYLRGFQGVREPEGIKRGVSCMTKHFPGGGPQKDGEDPHFAYGKEQVYPGGKFEYHLKPFEDLIAAGTRWIMPYYGQPMGLEGVEEVGFAFNKGVITTLLREKMGYKGLVCTDWGLVTKKMILGQDMPARAWGCEHLSELERVVKILNAGCDQFGGEARPELVVEAVEKGLVSEKEVIDVCVGRLLTEKFELGLFDDPFVDVDAAADVVGKSELVEAGLDAQRRSLTLLKNDGNVLPLKTSASSKVYAEGISSTDLASHGLTVVTDPSTADVALIRLRAPFTPRSGGFEQFFHAGTLEFSREETTRLRKIFATVAISIIDVYLDRPAVLTPLVVDESGEGKAATGVLASYGTSGPALLDVVFGQEVKGKKSAPEGKLPFDLPRSMKAVEKSREDVPFDTQDPLYKFGHGLRYQ